jgi:hypothetical protein
VPSHAITGRRPIRDHQEPGDPGRDPAAVPDDPRRQPSLPIEPDHRAAGIPDRRLDLDDGQHAPRAMPGQHVDRTALAVDRKGDLDGRFPAGADEQGDGPVDDARVPFINEPVEALAAPPQLEVEPGVEGVDGRDQVAERHAPDLASFDSAVGTSRQSGPSRDVGLALVAPTPQLSQRSPEPDAVHRGIMEPAA